MRIVNKTTHPGGGLHRLMHVIMMIALLAVGPSALVAQTNLTVLGTTPTQVLFSYNAGTQEDNCSIEVSEKADFSELVNDINPALFPGDQTDSRAIVRQGLTRLVVVGHRRSDPSSGRFYSRALRSATQHFLRVSCGQTNATTDFITTETAGLSPESLPFHPEADGNMAVPDFDWNDRSKPVIDPQSGVAIYRVSDPRDFSSNTDANFTGTVFGGIGWTNLSNIKSASTTTLASTSNQNAVFLPIDSFAANTVGGWPLSSTLSHPITDMALRIFGNGTSTAPEHRTLSVCLTINSGASCFGKTINVTLPSGAARDAGTIPSNYPAPLFAGWEKVITRDFLTSRGIITAAGGVLTLVKDSGGTPINSNFQSTSARFMQEWKPGSKILIANSAPVCPENYCTISSVQSQTQLTILENLTAGESFYTFAGLGFLVWKNTDTGSVSLSLGYKLAKSFVMHTGASCSGRTVETSVDRSGAPLGRTIKGYLCVFQWMRNSGGRLYFVGSSEPEIRLLSLFKQPGAIANHVAADLPAAIGEIAGPRGDNFDANDPNVMYTGLPTQGGSFSVFKLTYQGDYRENSAVFWNSRADSTPATGDNNIVWENVMKSTEGKDLRSQILAKTTYKESDWGTLSNRLNFIGFANGYAGFYTTPVGGSETPCWIFTVDSKTGELALGWNTLNSGGPGSLGGGCHAIFSTVGRIFVANNGLRNANSSSQWGGPFETAILGVLRNGSFSTTLALPGIPDASYDSACPSDLPDQWKALGATGNQCVTLKVAGEPCSSFATAAEKLITPCPTDSNKSWVGAPVGEGQQFYDGGQYFDNEHMLVVRRQDVSDGIILTMLRDAAPGYCCQVGNARGRICLAGPGQAVHTEGWKLRMVPAGSCGAVSQLYDPINGAYRVEEPNMIRGHFSYALLNSGNHTFAGVGSVGAGYLGRFDVPPSQIGSLYTATFAQWPSFAGISSAMPGSVQSYIAVGGQSAGPFERKFATDWRHPNGNVGIDVEASRQTIGISYTVALESGTTSVYRVAGITGTHDPKRTPLIVWVGRYVLLEKSSPKTGDVLTDADTWQFCYALRTGECRAGSTPGALYVVAPGLETQDTFCNASQISYRSLCVFAGTSIFGQVMQLRIDTNDPAGLWQRRLGYALTRPGSQYVYSAAGPSPDGLGVFATAWNLQGVYSVPIYMKLPPWRQDSVNRTTFVPVPVNPPAGAGSSYVEFGYEEFGRPDQFFCTERAERCRVVSATVNEQAPFLWEGEPIVGSTTGTISIPALPSRVLFYRIVSNGIPGPIQAVPVP